MGYSQLSERCQKCNHKDICQNKRMEALAALQLSTTMHIAGIPIIVYKDEIEKQLYKKLYEGLSVCHGA